MYLGHTQDVPVVSVCRKECKSIRTCILNRAVKSSQIRIPRVRNWTKIRAFHWLYYIHLKLYPKFMVSAAPDSSFYSTTTDPSNSIGSDALEVASLTWTERPKYVELSALLSVTDVKGATVNSTPKSQPSWIGSDERSQVAKPTGKPTTCADVDIGECCENRTTTEAVKLPISSSTPSKVASLIVDTAVAQDHDSQSLKPDHGEPDSPSYTQLATLISGDSDVRVSAKEKRLQPNKPYTIRQVRKLLAGFKVQSSAKTSFMRAPPKELFGVATQRSKPHRDTFRPNRANLPKNPNRRKIAP
ncbi:hypothetical protein CLF_106989 [Clonorchis sinensis]|uniref:Uncharacterized protein n=1 Tax=Clonorchis sinensis TaxID=79923 RepID=G7YG22_CLOSI|nr:hypothetical protein CLF_106989 [Clonorchis sinensis]